MNVGIDGAAEALVERQRAAQRLVTDEGIRHAFERLKADYVKAFANTQPADKDKRETAYMLYKAVSDLWASLERDARNAQARDLTARDQSNG